jgi:hypothetical protein
MQGSSPSSLGAEKPSLDLPEGLFEIFLVVVLEGTSGVGDGGGARGGCRESAVFFSFKTLELREK